METDFDGEHGRAANLGRGADNRRGTGANHRRASESDALVFPALGLRLNYAEFRARVDEAALGLLSLGHRPRRPRRDLGHQRARMGDLAIRHGADRRGVGHDQSGLPPLRTGIRPAAKRCRGAVSGRSLQVVRLFRHAGRSLPWPGISYRGRIALSTSSPSCAGWWPSRANRRAGRFRGRNAAAAARSTRAISMPCCHALAPGDPINIQYTSGTTGFPKAAMLSHRNLLFNAYLRRRVPAAERSTDRICIPVPFYHCFGCVLGTHVRGRARRGDDRARRIVPTRRHARRHRAPASDGASTACRRCSSPNCSTRTFAGRDLSSLRTGIMAGSPCPIEVMRQVDPTRWGPARSRSPTARRRPRP